VCLPTLHALLSANAEFASAHAGRLVAIAPQQARILYAEEWRVYQDARCKIHGMSLQ
jgi:hypothetical protein